MQRMGDEPVFPIDHDHPWRAVHVANAAILTPEESPDGRWRMYIRGSGYFPEEDSPRGNYHDSIGLFTQKPHRFSPRGPWKKHSKNPILVHGPDDGYDGKHLLDCAPLWVKGREGFPDKFHMFYKGVSHDNGAGCLAGAYSTDGGRSFTKFESNPMKEYAGPCDAVYHNNQYYIFYGDLKFDLKTGQPTDRLKIYLAITSDPKKIGDAKRHLVIDTGPEGSYDNLSVHGGRIFKLNDRWYMVYQCSDRHVDYPNRFHVAWSDNLVDWSKVDNPRPFFKRGEPAQWDECAIWYGEVFEYEKTLYMYYEGWGSGQPGYDREKPYAPGGRSQIGLASVSVQAFLDWCGHD